MFQEARMGKAIDAAQSAALVQEISDSVTRNPGALISLARLKTADEYTYMHSVAVCALMIALARQLKLDAEATRQAGLAGLLHDLGKARISMQVLNKPGKLNDVEFAQVKRHPQLGHELLVEGRGVGEIALDVCLHHHEKIDGSGYPHGLQAGQISLYAKMGAVCDVYDAITSNRPYPGRTVGRRRAAGLIARLSASMLGTHVPRLQQPRRRLARTCGRSSPRRRLRGGGVVKPQPLALLRCDSSAVNCHPVGRTAYCRPARLAAHAS